MDSIVLVVVVRIVILLLVLTQQCSRVKVYVSFEIQLRKSI